MEDIIMKSLIECLSSIPDYRVGNAVEHKLIDIMAIAILGTICCADTWTDIEDFGEAKKEWLSTFLELPNGIPSHNTFGRVFANIDPEAFHNAFIEWVSGTTDLIKGQVISIDGKTVRRSHDRKNNKPAIHVVSAWANENKLVLGQKKVDGKTNEITAIPALLKLLDVSGCIISIDAMGTQKEIADTIVKSNADYILALKENQKTLHDDVELYFKEEILTKPKKDLKKEGKYHVTYDKSHGRIEKREYFIERDIQWLSQKNSWKKLSSIGMVVCQITEGEKHSKENRYYINSLECNAEEFAKYQRSHWGIENSLHWVLDVAFREDDSRVRKDHSPENLSILRHMTLNLLKQEKTLKRGIKGKRLKCGWDNDYLFKVLGIDTNLDT
jgi:predicted transposase YbfD/YdcC